MAEAVTGHTVKRGAVTVVLWTDAAHIAPGEWLEDVGDTRVNVTTVGLLVRATKKHVVVAHTLDESGNVTGVFSIPRGVIRKVTQLTK